LLALDRNGDNFYDEASKLEKQFNKIPGYENYVHDRLRTVSHKYVFEYTSDLLRRFGQYGDEEEKAYVMKLTPEIVEAVL